MRYLHYYIAVKLANQRIFKFLFQSIIFIACLSNKLKSTRQKRQTEIYLIKMEHYIPCNYCQTMKKSKC